MAKNQDYDYVRRYYGVPAEKGALVKHPKEGRGRVTHAGGHHIWITWDTNPAKERGPYHPTDELTYLDGPLPGAAEEE